MLAGTALYIHLLVYAGLSLFIISGLYVYMVVWVVYAYNLTLHSTVILWLSFHGKMPFAWSSDEKTEDPLGNNLLQHKPLKSIIGRPPSGKFRYS